MKLATYAGLAGPCPAIVEEDRLLPIGGGAWSGPGSAPDSVLRLIQGGEAAMQAVRAHRDRAGAAAWRKLAEARLLAPIPRPAKNVFCVGRNYKLHIEEGARSRGVPVSFPPVPEFFSKPPTAVIGTGEAIRLPTVTTKLDYEVELAFVIGRTARDIRPEEARAHIFGFTVANDVSARDLQRAHGQWFKGKSLDTSCPLGPWIVTTDTFDPDIDHRLWLSVNGEMRQDAMMSDMLFGCAEILASLSAGMTVEAGDIVATGTPSGVGLGFEPPIWLSDGDIVVAGIDGIGSITNTVRAA